MDMKKKAELLFSSRIRPEAGYDGTVTLDHTPVFPEAYNAGSGTAFAIGYMRALLQRAIISNG